MSSNSTAKKVGKMQDRVRLASGISPEAVVRKAFEDIALIIGSAVTLHQLNDELAWSVMKRLDRVRIQLFRTLRGAPSDQHAPDPSDTPQLHAAVEEFLVRNRAALGEGGRA